MTTPAVPDWRTQTLQSHCPHNMANKLLLSLLVIALAVCATAMGT